MISLFVEMAVWAVRLMVVVCVLFAKAVAWSYREADRLIHSYRTAKDPGASREASQVMAGALVAGVLGVLVLAGSVTGDSNSAPLATTGPAATIHEPVKARSASAHRRAVRAVRARRGRAAERARAVRRVRAARRTRIARAHRREQRLVASAAVAAPQCNENYSGCLKPDASDYDCAGGEGDGPEYTGIVTVEGYDEYDLDADDDGTACEPA